VERKNIAAGAVSRSEVNCTRLVVSELTSLRNSIALISPMAATDDRSSGWAGNFVQAALSSSGDHIHCICDPVRTRVASLEPGSAE
jgi:hypothetical protein